MRCCLMSTHRQSGIKQQHALLCPTPETAIGRYRPAQISLYLLEDINKRGRRHHPFLHREAQSFSLSRLMIRVLSYYHHLHLVERTEVEGIENLVSGRVTDSGRIFSTHKIYKTCEIRLVELLSHTCRPRRIYLHIHFNKANKIIPTNKEYQ